jgi:lipoate---protein ligase
VPEATWLDVDALRAQRQPLVLWRSVAGPAVVLGSSQSAALVPVAAAQRAGYAVLRRRGGGGIVHLAPADPLCVDVWLPSADALWEDDVVRATRWLGQAWAAALEHLGVAGALVHEGPPSTSAAGRGVCFGGIGPGEVSVGGRKVVGISQWRCRDGALFSCAVYHRWEPETLAVDLMVVPGVARTALIAALEAAAVGLDDLIGPVPDPVVRDAFLAALPPTSPWWRSTAI